MIDMRAQHNAGSGQTAGSSASGTFSIRDIRTPAENCRSPRSGGCLLWINAKRREYTMMHDVGADDNRQLNRFLDVEILPHLFEDSIGNNRPLLHRVDIRQPCPLPLIKQI